ncbi:MAG: decaprenyl-phosphate phosphoribosyltransferase [Anaerolineaceae bacterium]|nr:decaprenyl-phosphate phosphoribosyltransferase [Anaerolineaceae bacterium]
MKAMLESLRPRQWVKNCVLFAGLVFDGQLNQLTPFLRVLAAALIFCVVSGITYTINDLLDYKSDRSHPTKKNRPIASGRLSPKKAITMILFLAVLALAGAFALSPYFGLLCILYTLLMLAYSKWLKQVMIIDVMIIALGFVLRVIAGLLVIQVRYFSPWLLVLTTLLALYLGFGKRLSELRLLEDSAGVHRKVLMGYSAELLNHYLNVILSGIVITYCMYTFNAHPDSNNHWMMLTIPFVLYGVFRYSYLIQSSTIGAAPEDVLLNDRPLQLAILLWGLMAVFLIYFFR